MTKFDFYYGREAEQFTFFRIPKILFTDKRFSSLSPEAKLLYGLMLDRMSLSMKNGWIDKENRVYIYFKLEEAMELLGVGKDKGVKIFAELDSENGCGLIRRKRQGLGKPVIIYVMNFCCAEKNAPEESYPHSECDDTYLAEVQTSEKQNSCLPENTPHRTSDKPNSDFCKIASNNTENNNNNISYTEINNIYPSYQREEEPGGMDGMDDRSVYRKKICMNIEYDCLLSNYGKGMIDGIVDIMVDAVCSRRNFLIVNGDEIPHTAVKERFLKLDYRHIEYVLDCLNNNTARIKNIRGYLLTALYNSSVTMEHYYTAEANHDLTDRKIIRNAECVIRNCIGSLTA